MGKRIHNGYWLASLIGLSALTFFFYSYGDGKKENYDADKFTLEVNSIITSVELSSQDFTLSFQYINGEWKVNDSIVMDPGMRDAFFTVVSSIKIKRPVGINQRDSIANYLLNDGINVKISNNQNLIENYLVGGDEVRGVSYFMLPEEGIPYEVTLPGYDSYVAGIYSVPEKDWRDRFLFQLEWSSLKAIQVEYTDPQKQGFYVSYREDFFYFDESTDPLDSAIIFDYIGELINLQAEKFLAKGEDPLYDSLLNTSPESKITVSTIGVENQELEIWPRIQGRRWVLARFDGKLLSLFDPRALAPVLIQSTDWE